MHAEEYASQQALQIVGAIKDRTIIEFRDRGRYAADRWTPEDHKDGRQIDEFAMSKTVAAYRDLLTARAAPPAIDTAAGQVRVSDDGHALIVGKLWISLAVLHAWQEHGLYGQFKFRVGGDLDNPTPIITELRLGALAGREDGGVQG